MYVRNRSAPAEPRPARTLGQITRENTRLRRLVLRDELTGLANRRQLQTRLQGAMLAARRTGHGVALALYDLTGLKDINDTFGHATGDGALRAFARRLRMIAAPGDVVARVSGDEFAVLVPAIPTGAMPRATARLTAAGESFVYTNARGQTMMVSAATGVATSAGDGAAAMELLACADAHLNAAKYEVGQAMPFPTGTVYVPRGRHAMAEETVALLTLAGQITSAADPRQTLRLAADGAAHLIGSTATWTVYPHAWHRDLPSYSHHNVESLSAAPWLEIATANHPRPTTVHPPTLAVPVIGAGGVPVAGMIFSARYGDAPFGPREEGLAHAFAAMVATVLARTLPAAQGSARPDPASQNGYPHVPAPYGNDAIFVLDPRECHLTPLNHAALHLSQSMHIVAGKACSADSMAALMGCGLQICRDREALAFTGTLRLPDGRPFVLEGSALPVAGPAAPLVQIRLRESAAIGSSAAD